jgi:hypothetical protein
MLADAPWSSLLASLLATVVRQHKHLNGRFGGGFLVLCRYAPSPGARRHTPADDADRHPDGPVLASQLTRHRALDGKALGGVAELLEIRTQALARAHRLRVRARSSLAPDPRSWALRGRGHDARRVCLVMHHLAPLFRTRGGGRRQSGGAHQRRGAETQRLCNVCGAGRAKGQGIGPWCWRRAPCHLVHASGQRMVQQTR